jgi:MEMO1 family protein
MAVKYRSTIVDGIFYPETKEELETVLGALFNDIPKGSARAIITPHAGYTYSGEIAARAFQATATRTFKRAVIIGPLHREQEDALFLPDSDVFTTPLGELPVDKDLIAELASCSNQFIVNDIPHLEEHSIEVELPFLQHLFPGLPIVPILVGKTTATNVKTLSRALEVILAGLWEETLIVVSTNLCAFVPATDADRQSGRFLDLIREKDWQGILDGHRDKEITACGDGCVAGLLGAPSVSKLEVSILQRGDSSSQQHEDDSNRVHYAAVALA